MPLAWVPMSPSAVARGAVGVIAATDVGVGVGVGAETVGVGVEAMSTAAGAWTAVGVGTATGAGAGALALPQATARAVAIAMATRYAHRGRGPPLRKLDVVFILTSRPFTRSSSCWSIGCGESPWRLAGGVRETRLPCTSRGRPAAGPWTGPRSRSRRPPRRVLA